MTVRLEHANLFVRDVDATIRFLQTALPEFRIRFDGRDPRGRRWVHIGTDDTYIALTESTVEPEQRWTPYVGVPGVNHLAYEVDDVEALRKRLQSADYKDSTVPNKHAYRKRVYFYDPDGNDWEFIQYLSDDPAKRHDYTLPAIDIERSGLTVGAEPAGSYWLLGSFLRVQCFAWLVGFAPFPPAGPMNRNVSRFSVCGQTS